MSIAKKALLVIVLVVGVSFLHYFTNLQFHLQHVVYREFYFFPIFLAGLWFGLKGALVTSLSVTGIYLPFLIITWTDLSVSAFNNLVQVLLFNVVAATVGWLVDRERAENERLRESENLAAMGKAMSALAHDIKTPLIAIGGFSRLVQKRLGEGDSNKEKLDVVVQETQRLENMLKEALDFSRPLELHLSREDINEAIAHSLSIVAPVAEDKRVSLTNRSYNHIPEFFFDLERMERALINLLTNAIQASPEGKTVEVISLRERNSVEVDVKDYGSGVPDENKEKLFLPFFTTKKEGTGLGLPIVKKIIDAHGGRLEVLDNQPEGAVFRVLLPLKTER